jgi:hypothetical protein
VLVDRERACRCEAQLIACPAQSLDLFVWKTDGPLPLLEQCALVCFELLYELCPCFGRVVLVSDGIRPEQEEINECFDKPIWWIFFDEPTARIRVGAVFSETAESFPGLDVVRVRAVIEGNGGSIDRQTWGSDCLRIDHWLRDDYRSARARRMLVCRPAVKNPQDLFDFPRNSDLSGRKALTLYQASSQADVRESEPS